MSHTELDLKLARALRELPLERPSEDRWQAIARALPPAPLVPRRAVRWPWLAGMAASLCLALYSNLPVAKLQPTVAEVSPLNALIARSQALEARFEAQRSAPARLSFEQLETERQVQMVLSALDGEIAAQPEAEELWRQRVQVLDALSEPDAMHAVAYFVD